MAFQLRILSLLGIAGLMSGGVWGMEGDSNSKEHPTKMPSVLVFFDYESGSRTSRCSKKINFRQEQLKEESSQEGKESANKGTYCKTNSLEKIDKKPTEEKSPKFDENQEQNFERKGNKIVFLNLGQRPQTALPPNKKVTGINKISSKKPEGPITGSNQISLYPFTKEEKPRVTFSINKPPFGGNKSKKK